MTNRPFRLFEDPIPDIIVRQVGSRRALDLARFFDIIMPGQGAFPSAKEAGVLTYLANMWQDRLEDDPDYIQDVVIPRYVGVLDSLSMAALAAGAPSFDQMQTGAENAVRRLAADPATSTPFGLVRNDCVEGYFAHPRWRSGKAQHNWPTLHIVAQYPGFMPECKPENRAEGTKCVELPKI